MPRGVKLVFHPKAFERILRGPETLAMVKAKGEAIAAACNEQSSWGGYFTAASDDGERARAKVWSADRRNDEARDNRMVKNLDA